MEQYLFGLGLIVLIIHVLLCAEVGKVAKKKGVKYFDAFLVSFFGTPILGFLYVIARSLPDREIEKDEREEFEKAVLSGKIR